MQGPCDKCHHGKSSRRVSRRRLRLDVRSRRSRNTDRYVGRRANQRSRGFKHIFVDGRGGEGAYDIFDTKDHAGVRVDNHAIEEVGVVKLLIVNDGEDLGLDADLHVRVEGIEADDTIVTEDTVVERSLVLIDGATGAGGGVLVCKEFPKTAVGSRVFASVA